MGSISSKLLFLTTSPRTPEKMIPEIDLLIKHFEGGVWNKKTQIAFMDVLRQEDFFNGEGKNDPSLSARDRITRGPKSLGFVLLKPTIQLTPAGSLLLQSKRKDEVFLRQLLKFQIPSPYHKPTKDAAKFRIKPYLEILRLVRTMGTLKFDELQMFGMQMTNYRDFDKIVRKIEDFRVAKEMKKGSYRVFKTNYLNNELQRIFEKDIKQGKLKTRGSKDTSLKKFLRTKSKNMHDYADACFRYLRATGLVNVSHVGKSLSIVPERIADVDFILQNVSREPVFVENLNSYVSYLGNAALPELLTDNRLVLEQRIGEQFPDKSISADATLENLKDMFSNLLQQLKLQNISKQIVEIKDYRQYNDIQKTYEQIENNELFDAPLMLEWNTWRAMTMLDGGNIKANLKFDDFGKPLSTAAGNMSDIVCDYDDFCVCVEVTTANGQRQYETESEPVMRHLGKLRKAVGKPCYGLFIAPKINESSISYFYTLHHINLASYGGNLVIVPLPVNVFRKMVEDSYKAGYTPNPNHIRSFFEASTEYAQHSSSEIDWYESIKNKALHWLD